MSYTISKEFHFSASHQLRGLVRDHPCGRLHGHNYRLRVELSANAVDRVGFVLDYGALAPFSRWLDAEVDHRHLNDLHPFSNPVDGGERVNPTAENLSRWLTAAVVREVAPPTNVAVRVWVSETDKTWAVWDPTGIVDMP